MISALCVDDEPSLLILTRTYLEGTGGFRIETAGSGAHALRLLEERSFDVVISDYEMPDMDGIELLKVVRSRWKNIPFIIFTGRGREDVVIRAYEHGADFYIQKGGEPKAQFVELIHKIREAVNRREMDAALRASEERFAKAFSLSPVATSLCTFPEGRFLDINQAFTDITGYSRSEVLGKTGADLGLEANPEIRNGVLSPLHNGESIRNREIQLTGKNGRKNTALLSADTFPIGEKTYALTYTLDITGQKHHEEDLLKRDAILRSIAVSAGNLLRSPDPDRTIPEILKNLGTAIGVWRVYVYTKAGTPEHPLAILQYEWVSEGEVSWKGNPLHDRVPYREAGYQDLEERLLSGGSITYFIDEIPRRTPPGTDPRATRSVAMVPILVKDAVWGVIGFEADPGKKWLTGELDALKTAAVLIGSAIKNAEVLKTLKEREMNYHTLINTSPDGITVTDTRGRITYASAAALALFGLTDPAEAIGTVIFDWIAPEMREEAIQRVVRFIGTQYLPRGLGEYPLIRKDGSRFYAEISSAVQTDGDGKPTGMISLLREVTGRVRDREKLLQSEEIHRALFENSPDGILIMDRAGRIETVSRNVLGLLGTPAEADIPGTTLFDWTSPEDHEGIRKYTRDLIRTGRPGVHPLWMYRKDGSSFYAEINAAILHESSGNSGKIIAHIRDISRRIKTEDALRRANTRLNLLSSITCHDLQNKILVTRGYLDLLEETEDPAYIRTYLPKIHDSVAVMEKHLDFIRDYQNISMKSPEWQDMGYTFVQVLSQVDPGPVRVENGLSGVSLFADPLFEKVLYNLMDNALRYGGGTLTRIHAAYCLQGDSCILFLEDDGTGIPGDQKERIFERGVGNGTGLGLFLVREILGITGMTIRETGEPGNGARFEIRIPKGKFRIS